MTNLKFCQNFKGNFVVFSKTLILSNFWRKFVKSIENLKRCICMGLGGAPEASDFIKSIVEKSMKTWNFLKILKKFCDFFGNNF